MIHLDELRFSVNSILPVFNPNTWQLTNASIYNNQLIIQPGGSAFIQPTQTILNMCFQYSKIAVEFQSEGMKPSNNFKSGPKIEIEETYKNSNNDIEQNITRCLGFNVYNPIDKAANIYRDETICRMQNKNIAEYTFNIINNSDDVLTIISIGVYSSIDVSDDQIGGVINRINAETDPEAFKVYTDSTYTDLLGLSVILKNSDKEIKYKPIYSNGLLVKIETNFDIEYPVIYVPEDIDLTT